MGGHQLGVDGDPNASGGVDDEFIYAVVIHGNGNGNGYFRYS